MYQNFLGISLPLRQIVGQLSADGIMSPVACSFGFIKYKTRDAANAALASLGGKQMADFPGQAVSPQLSSNC